MADEVGFEPTVDMTPTAIFKIAAMTILPLIRIGRSGGDRTRGHRLPKPVRCHAALRSEKMRAAPPVDAAPASADYPNPEPSPT